MLGEYDWGSDDDYQVGSNTRIKTTWGEVIEGRVSSYDKARNIVSIRVYFIDQAKDRVSLDFYLLFLEVPFPDNNSQKTIRVININAIAATLLGTIHSLESHRKFIHSFVRCSDEQFKPFTSFNERSTKC